MRTYVFDAGAILAWLLDKPAVVQVRRLIDEAMRARSEILMSAVNFGEVYSTLLRAYDPDRASMMMRTLQPLPIDLVSVDRQGALSAAAVKVKYRLYYADSFAAALAIESKATLVTGDSDFRRLGHGFPILWLKS
jgi:predicted nucleic acid-binding protein